MTNFNIDLEKIAKQTFIESFDINKFIEQLAHDVQFENPEWWARKIVTPLKDTLSKAILENKEFLKEIIMEFISQEFGEKIEDEITEKINECVEKVIKDRLPKFKIVMENEE